MTFYQRRLRRLHANEQQVFVTWRLHGSLPPNRAFPAGALTSGRAFAAMDRLLDEATADPFRLLQAALADMVVEAIHSIHYNAAALGQYEENPAPAGLVGQRQRVSVVQRGLGDQGVARGPGGPPHYQPEPVSTSESCLLG